MARLYASWFVSLSPPLLYPGPSGRRVEGCIYPLLLMFFRPCKAQQGSCLWWWWWWWRWWLMLVVWWRWWWTGSGYFFFLLLFFLLLLTSSTFAASLLWWEQRLQILHVTKQGAINDADPWTSLPLIYSFPWKSSHDFPPYSRYTVLVCVTPVIFIPCMTLLGESLTPLLHLCLFHNNLLILLHHCIYMFHIDRKGCMCSK